MKRSNKTNIEIKFKQNNVMRKNETKNYRTDGLMNRKERSYVDIRIYAIYKFILFANMHDIPLSFK